MWFCRFFLAFLIFFSSCSEKKELTMCDCAELNVKMGFFPYDDLNSVSKKLIRDNYGEEYLACDKIISDWKIKLSTATEEEKIRMIKGVEGCVVDEKLDKPVMRKE